MRLAQAANIIGNIGSAASGASPKLDRVTKAVGGVAQGAATGALTFGVWGAAIGAVAGALPGLIELLNGTAEATELARTEADEYADSLMALTKQLKARADAEKFVDDVLMGRSKDPQAYEALLLDLNRKRLEAVRELSDLERDASPSDAQVERINFLTERIRILSSAAVRAGEDLRRAGLAADQPNTPDLGTGGFSSSPGAGTSTRGGRRRTFDLSDSARDALSATSKEMGSAAGAERTSEAAEVESRERRYADSLAAEEAHLTALTALKAKHEEDLRIIAEEADAEAETRRERIKEGLSETFVTVGQLGKAAVEGDKKAVKQILKGKAIQLAIRGGEEVAEGISKTLVPGKQGEAAAHFAAAAKFFAVSAAAGGAAAAAGGGGGSKGGGGGSKDRVPTAARSSGETQPRNVTINFNAPVAEEQIARMNSRAATVAKRRFAD